MIKLKRDITLKIEQWYADEKHLPLMIKGMRRVGKTLNINTFLNNHSNVVRFDLLNVPNDKEFFEQSFRTKEAFYIEVLSYTGKSINDETLIFIDEVQESEAAYMFIKLYEGWDNRNNLIVSGSYIDNTVINRNYNIPLGCYQPIVMYPLSFKEFVLNIKGGYELFTLMQSTIVNNQEMLSKHHHYKMLELYDSFIKVGGMPINVISYLTNNVKAIETYSETIRVDQLNDLRKGLHKPDQKKIEELYSAIQKGYNVTGIPLPKFKYTTIKKGARRLEYINSINLLKRSNIIHIIQRLGGDLGYIKLSHADPSLFRNDSSGWLTEEFIGMELLKEDIVTNLQYWYIPPTPKTKPRELDFVYKVLGTNEWIGIDAKSGSDNTPSTSLKEFSNEKDPKQLFIISRKNYVGPNEYKITKLPLYAVSLIPELIKKI